MITKRFDYTPLNRTTIDGKRHYCLPNGDHVASVTTILDRTKSQESRDALNNWKKRVGEKQAAEIVKEAGSRGTRMHAYLESYILQDDMKPLPSNPFAHPSWFMAAEVIMKGLVNVDEFWGSEVPLSYSGLYAGTTDACGIRNGKPAIFDFKQTNKPKKEEWIEDYYLQLSAYIMAHDEMFGTKIEQGVIMMCALPKLLEDNTYSTPEYQEFIIEGDRLDRYKDLWTKRVELYYLTN